MIMKRFYTNLEKHFKLLLLCFFLIGGSFQSWGQTPVTVSDATEACVEQPSDVHTYTLAVAPSGNVVDGSVEVKFDVYHAKKEQVEITLCAPDGTTCSTIHSGTTTGDLGNSSGSGYGSPAQYTINDTGATTIDGDSGDSPPATYRANDLFATTFNGVPATGNWTLTINDNDGGFTNQGCMRNVELSLSVESACTPVESAALTLATDTGTTDEVAVAISGESPAGGTFTATCGACVSGTTFNPCLAGVGTHTISYTYSDVNGCETIATDDFTVTAGTASGTIYVDYTNGSNANSGSICSPKQTVEGAHAAASNGDLIQILPLTGGTVIDEDALASGSNVVVSKSVTIDGGGNTINRSSGTQAAFDFSGSGNTMKLQNITLCNFNEGGGEGAAIGVYSSVNIPVEFENVVVSNSLSSHAIGLYAPANFTNCTISGNAMQGIFVGDSDVSSMNINITNTTINCNNALSGTTAGGGIRVDVTGDHDVQMSITGGSIANNNDDGSNITIKEGGGIYFECGGGSSLTIDGTNFVGNHADAASGSNGGGAIYIIENSFGSGVNFTVTNAQFENNNSGNGAGAIYAQNVTGNISNSVFRNNTSSGSVVDGGTYTNCIFQGNNGSSPAASSSFVQGSASNYTTDFNVSGVVISSCTGTCDGSTGFATGESISGPSPCATPGGTLTSTTTGQWWYQQGSTATMIAGETGMTVNIPAGLSGFTVFWQEVATGSDPMIGFTVGAGLTADAGTDDSELVGTPVTLAANNPAIDGNTGMWSIVSGPGAGSFGDATVFNTVFTPNAAGDYTLRWTVSDGGACPGQDEVVITGLAPVVVSGTVFDDGNGLSNSTVDGAGLDGTASGPMGVQMYLNVVSGGAIVTSVALASDGTYSFPNFYPNTAGYTVVLSTSPTSITPSLPSGWEFTGEDFGNNNLAGTGTESTTLGEVAVETGTTQITSLSIGVNKLPETTSMTTSNQANPNGDGQADVAAMNVFSAADLESTISSINITQFPTGAASFVVGTVTYYPTTGDIPATCPTATCVAFPATGGVDVPTDASGNPTSLTVDPASASASDVVFSYTTSDEAGAVSAVGQATIQFLAQPVLPIELIFFTAKAQNCEAKLTWATATEVNNAYFEIQRSRDGYAFETIEKIAGAGTTEATQHYQFMDENPLANNYYRLKQVDFDGQFDYSDIEIVNTNNCQGTGTISVYPNPVRNDLTVELTVAQDGEAQVVIFDYSGKQITDLSVNLNSGVNAVPVSTSHLQAGIYFVQVLNNGKISELVKFVKH